jgi:hypothetical protein
MIKIKNEIKIESEIKNEKHEKPARKPRSWIDRKSSHISNEAFAKLALRAKFDDFDVGSFFRKLTYPTGHRRFAKNSNPTLKAQIWLQMEFCKSL